MVRPIKFYVSLLCYTIELEHVPPIPTLELRAPGRRRKQACDLNVLDVAGDGIWEMILTFCSYSMMWRRMTLCIENKAQSYLRIKYVSVFHICSLRICLFLFLGQCTGHSQSLCDNVLPSIPKS